MKKDKIILKGGSLIFHKFRLSSISNEEYDIIISNLDFEDITYDIWNIIQDEGLDEEFDALDIKNWEFAILPISDDDRKGLMEFNDAYIEKFNDFDWILKEKYHMKYIDLIDYEEGIIRIVKVKNQ